MARKAKNVALDRAQEKAKKQKRLAIILCSVLALVLVYEVPKTMKLMSATATAPVVETSASTPPAPNPIAPTSAPSSGPFASPPPAAAQSSALAQSIVASVQVQPDPGQLTEFARFASKDPFLQSVQKSGAAAASAGSSSKSSTAQPKTTTTGAPKAPPAPSPTSAVISINGELTSVIVGTDFPLAGVVFQQAGNAPLFHLVSLTQKSAKVAIAGGSYANGTPALTLTVGTPVTLQNTADGTRYTLLLEPQGTQVPTSTTPTGTTPTATTPATTTPSVVPSSGSGG
jgi:hypothetical protein